MTHGESGAHRGLVQPYCLLPAGLHRAPAGLSVQLCDVDVMEGKTFNTSALSGCSAAGTPAVTGPGATRAGEPDR